MKGRCAHSVHWRASWHVATPAGKRALVFLPPGAHVNTAHAHPPSPCLTNHTCSRFPPLRLLSLLVPPRPSNSLNTHTHPHTHINTHTYIHTHTHLVQAAAGVAEPLRVAQLVHVHQQAVGVAALYVHRAGASAAAHRAQTGPAALDLRGEEAREGGRWVHIAIPHKQAKQIQDSAILEEGRWGEVGPAAVLRHGPDFQHMSPVRTTAHTPAVRLWSLITQPKKCHAPGWRCTRTACNPRASLRLPDSLTEVGSTTTRRRRWVLSISGP